MTVFKAFLKVINKNKGILIGYIVMLLVFGGFSLKTNETTSEFVASKPDVTIVNRDEDSKFTMSLVEFFDKKANIKDVDNLEDALFYRDVNYIITIPENFGSDFINDNKNDIKVKSTGDYQASLAEMYLEKYLSVATTYKKAKMSENEIIEKTESTLDKEVDITITSKLDTTSLDKATTFYNFMNYSLLAGGIMVVTLVLSSFNKEMIRKRSIISGMNYKKYNKILILSNSLFTILLWAFFVLMSFVMVGKIMFTSHGLVYILNSFVFAMCTLSISFLISNMVKNKEAINGIVNVVALGSSFLCGSFVPMAWLPDGVLKIAHILPSYYYIKTNELLKTVEVFDIKSLEPIICNAIAIIAFTIVFVTISNIVSRKRRRVD